MDVYKESNLWLLYLRERHFSKYSVKSFLLKGCSINVKLINETTMSMFIIVLKRFILTCFPGTSWFRCCKSLFSCMSLDNTTGVDVGEDAQLAMCNDVIDILVTILDAYDDLIDAVVNNNVFAMNEKLKPIPIYSINKNQFIGSNHELSVTSNMNTKNPTNSFVELSCSLLHMVDEFNWTLLQHACYHNCVDCVLELVSTLGVSIISTQPDPLSEASLFHQNEVWNDQLFHAMRSFENIEKVSTVLHTVMMSMHYDVIHCFLTRFNMRSAIIGVASSPTEATHTKHSMVLEPGLGSQWDESLLDNRGYTPMLAFIRAISLCKWSKVLTSVQLLDILRCVCSDDPYLVEYNRCDVWRRPQVVKRLKNEERMKGEEYFVTIAKKEYRPEDVLSQSNSSSQSLDGSVLQVNIPDRSVSEKELDEYGGNGEGYANYTAQGCLMDSKPFALLNQYEMCRLEKFVLDVETTGESMLEMLCKYCNDLDVTQHIINYAAKEFGALIKEVKQNENATSVGNAELMRDMHSRLEKMESQVRNILLHCIVKKRYRAMCQIVEGFSDMFAHQNNCQENDMYSCQLLCMNGVAQHSFISLCLCLAIQGKSVRILTYLLSRLSLDSVDSTPTSIPAPVIFPIMHYAVISNDEMIASIVTNKYSNNEHFLKYLHDPCSTSVDRADVREGHYRLIGNGVLSIYIEPILAALLPEFEYNNDPDGDGVKSVCDSGNRNGLLRICSPLGLLCLANSYRMLDRLLNSMEYAKQLHSEHLVCPGSNSPSTTTSWKHCSGVRGGLSLLSCCILVNAVDCMSVLRLFFKKFNNVGSELNYFEEMLLSTDTVLGIAPLTVLFRYLHFKERIESRSLDRCPSMRLSQHRWMHMLSLDRLINGLFSLIPMKQQPLIDAIHQFMHPVHAGNGAVGGVVYGECGDSMLELIMAGCSLELFRSIQCVAMDTLVKPMCSNSSPMSFADVSPTECGKEAAQILGIDGHVAQVLNELNKLWKEHFNLDNSVIILQKTQQIMSRVVIPYKHQYKRSHQQICSVLTSKHCLNSIRRFSCIPSNSRVQDEQPPFSPNWKEFMEFFCSLIKYLGKAHEKTAAKKLEGGLDITSLSFSQHPADSNPYGGAGISNFPSGLGLLGLPIQGSSSTLHYVKDFKSLFATETKFINTLNIMLQPLFYMNSTCCNSSWTDEIESQITREVLLNELLPMYRNISKDIFADLASNLAHHSDRPCRSGVSAIFSGSNTTSVAAPPYMYALRMFSSWVKHIMEHLCFIYHVSVDCISSEFVLDDRIADNAKEVAEHPRPTESTSVSSMANFFGEYSKFFVDLERIVDSPNELNVLQTDDAGSSSKSGSSSGISMFYGELNKRLFRLHSLTHRRSMLLTHSNEALLVNASPLPKWERGVTGEVDAVGRMGLQEFFCTLYGFIFNHYGSNYYTVDANYKPHEHAVSGHRDPPVGVSSNASNFSHWLSMHADPSTEPPGLPLETHVHPLVLSILKPRVGIMGHIVSEDEDGGHERSLLGRVKHEWVNYSRRVEEMYLLLLSRGYFDDILVISEASDNCYKDEHTSTRQSNTASASFSGTQQTRAHYLFYMASQRGLWQFCTSILRRCNDLSGGKINTAVIPGVPTPTVSFDHCGCLISLSSKPPDTSCFVESKSSNGILRNFESFGCLLKQKLIETRKISETCSNSVNDPCVESNNLFNIVCTPLHYAVLDNQVEFVKCYCDAYSMANYTNTNAEPLNLDLSLILLGISCANYDIVALLISRVKRFTNHYGFSSVSMYSEHRWWWQASLDPIPSGVVSSKSVRTPSGSLAYSIRSTHSVGVTTKTRIACFVQHLLLPTLYLSAVQYEILCLAGLYWLQDSIEYKHGIYAVCAGQNSPYRCSSGTHINGYSSLWCGLQLSSVHQMGSGPCGQGSAPSVVSFLPKIGASGALSRIPLPELRNNINLLFLTLANPLKSVAAGIEGYKVSMPPMHNRDYLHHFGALPLDDLSFLWWSSEIHSFLEDLCGNRAFDGSVSEEYGSYCLELDGAGVSPLYAALAVGFKSKSWTVGCGPTESWSIAQFMTQSLLRCFDKHRVECISKSSRSGLRDMYTYYTCNNPTMGRIRSQLRDMYLKPASIRLIEAENRLASYRNALRSNNKSTQPIFDLPPSECFSKSALLHVSLLKHLQNAQTAWNRITSVDNRRLVSKFINLLSGGSYSPSQTKTGVGSHSTSVEHSSFEVLDSVTKVKRVLVLLGIPFSKLLYTPKSVEMSEVESNPLLSPLVDSPCCLLNKDIGSLLEVSPAALKNVLHWDAAVELRDILLEWVGNRIQNSPTSTPALHAARNTFNSQTRTRIPILSSTLKHVLESVIVHQHVEMKHSLVDMKKDRIAVLESKYAISSIAHHGINGRVTSRAQTRQQMSPISARNECSGSGRSMSYYPESNILGSRVVNTGKSALQSTTSNLQLLSLPMQLQLETVKSYSNIGRKVTPSQYSSSAMNRVARDAEFENSTGVSYARLFSTFLTKYKTDSAEIFDILRVCYMILEFAQSLYMVRVAILLTTIPNGSVETGNGADARPSKNVLNNLVFFHPLDRFYSDIGAQKARKLVTNDVINAICGKPNLISDQKLVPCGIRAKISNLMTLDGILSDDWDSFWDSESEASHGLLFNHFRIIILDILSQLCQVLCRHDLCYELCSATRAFKKQTKPCYASDGDGDVAVPRRVKVDCKWKDDLLETLQSVRISDICMFKSTSEEIFEKLTRTLGFKCGSSSGAVNGISDDVEAFHPVEPFCSWIQQREGSLISESRSSSNPGQAQDWASWMCEKDVEELNRVLVDSVVVDSSASYPPKYLMSFQQKAAFVEAEKLKKSRIAVVNKLKVGLENGYSVMHKIIEFLVQVIQVHKSKNIYQNDPQKWVGNVFKNPLVPLVIHNLSNTDDDPSNGNRYTIQLCNEILALHDGFNCRNELLIACDSDGYNPIIMSALMGQDSLLGYFLGLLFPKDTNGNTTGVAFDCDSDASVCSRVGSASEWKCTARVEDVVEVIRKIDGSETLLWHVLWNCPSCSCSDYQLNASGRIKCCCSQCSNRRRYESCIELLLCFHFPVSCPTDTKLYHNFHCCSDIALLKQLAAAHRILRLEASCGFGHGFDSEDADSCTLSSIVTKPMLPLTSLQVACVALGSVSVDEHNEVEVTQMVDSVRLLTQPSRLTQLQLKYNSYEINRRVRVKEASTNLTGSSGELMDPVEDEGSLFALGDIDFHAEYVSKNVPYSQCVMSDNDLRAVFPTPSSIVHSNSGGLACCNENISKYVHLYVRYHLSVAMKKLLVSRKRGRGRIGCRNSIHGIMNCRCPLQTFLMNSLTQKVFPGYCLQNNKCISTDATSKSVVSSLKSVEFLIPPYSTLKAMCTPLNFALAFDEVCLSIDPQVNLVTTRRSLSRTLCSAYFESNGNGGGLTDASIDMGATESVVVQTLMQYACYYNRLDILDSLLRRYYHVDDLSLCKVGSVYVPTTRMTLASSLSYYFEPFHRKCSLIDIAVQADSYDVCVYFLPMPVLEKDVISTQVTNKLPIILDWHRLLVVSFINYPACTTATTTSISEANSRSNSILEHLLQYVTLLTTQNDVISIAWDSNVSDVVGSYINTPIVLRAPLTQQTHDYTSAVLLAPDRIVESEVGKDGALGLNYYYFRNDVDLGAMCSGSGASGKSGDQASARAKPIRIIQGESLMHAATRTGDRFLLSKLIRYGGCVDSLCELHIANGWTSSNVGVRERSRNASCGINVMDLSIIFGYAHLTSYLKQYFPKYTKAVQCILFRYRQYYYRKILKRNQLQRIEMLKSNNA